MSDFRGLRIAILGPFPPRPGGVSIQCATLATSLQEAGARVIRINTDVPGVRARGRAGKLMMPGAQVTHISQALRRTRHQWDVLHVHAASWWGFMPAVLGLQALAWGKNMVLTYHGGEAERFMARHSRFVTPVLRRYDHLLTLTPTQAAIFARYGLRPEVLPNIVPGSHFVFRPRGPVHPRLLWVRHFQAHYRPQDALAVLARVRQIYADTTLTLVGDGPLRPQLQAHAGPGAHFAGAQPPESLPAFYNEADIFLNTSAIDNLPLTLIEASASGLPIVSTNAGAIADLIQHEANGLLAPVGDVAMLAELVLSVISRANLARQLSLAARENARRFDWSAIAPQLAACYALT